METRSLETDRTGGLTVIAGNEGTTAVLPAGYPLQSASFSRLGRHLILRAPGYPDVVVSGFFAGGGQTTLRAANGEELSRPMAEVMANLSPRVENALNGLSAATGEG